MNIDKIVLNIPHSSYLYPHKSGYFKWDGDIWQHIDKWTDKDTDLLFKDDENAKSLIFPYSRFFCDAERLINDPKENEGEGIYYTNFKGIKRITNDEEKEFVMRCYHYQIDRIKENITSENTLLIDCHSFPRELSDFDLCIGWNEDWSKPCDELINLIKEHFSGLKIGINEPYSNSISPEKDFHYQSVMLEFNKRWYLNDNDFRDDKFVECHEKIKELYKKILKNGNFT